MAKPHKKQPEYLSLGDMWPRFLGGEDTAESFSIVATSSINQGRKFYSSPTEKLVMVECCDKSDSVGMISVLQEGATAPELFSFCPMLDGIEAKVEIEDIDYVPTDGLGFISFGFDWCDIVPLTARNPLFIPNKNFLSKGKAVIKLSGLAFMIERTPNEKITVSSGDLYKTCLNKFLAENPGKTEKDLPSVQVSMAHGSAFLHRELYDLYEYQSEVLSVKTINFMDNIFYRIEIEPIRDRQQDRTQRLYLYAAEHMLKGYVPRKGHNIRGTMALFGYMDRLPDKPFNVKNWKTVSVNTIQKQIQNGADVNMPIPGTGLKREEGVMYEKDYTLDKDKTPLEAAVCGCASYEVINLLLNAGASVHGNGWKPIDLAVRRGLDLKIVKLLLKHGAKLSDVRYDAYSSIRDKWLLDKMIENGADLHMLLGAQVAVNNIPLVKYLIKHGADLHGDNLYNETKPKNAPAKLPVIHSAHTAEMIDYLVSVGADVNEYGYYSTPLFGLVGWPHDMRKEINCLIKHGANVNAINENKKQTPLHRICRNEDRNAKPEQVIELLLNAGADATKLDMDSKKAIDYAKCNPAINKKSRAYKRLEKLSAIHIAPGDLELIHAVRDCKSPEVIRDLLTKVKDINAYDDEGMTALLYCVERNGNPETLQMLIDAGANVNQKNRFDGWPAVLYATYYYGYPAMLPMLIKAGADVNATAGFGSTPVMWAVKNVPINKPLKILLDAGADIRIRSVSGRNCLHMLIDNIFPDKDDKHNDQKYDWVGALDLLLNCKWTMELTDLAEVLDYLKYKDRDSWISDEIKEIIISHTQQHWKRSWAKCIEEQKSEINAYLTKRKTVPDELYIHAVSNGVEPEFIQKILPYIRDINATDKHGKTALHHMAENNGNIKMLRLLVKSGADVGIKDSMGKIAYDYLSADVWEQSLGDAQRLLKTTK